MEGLSPRQQTVYDYIDNYFVENGYCPSLADIAQGLNLHENTIVSHVTALRKKGAVKSEYRVARSLRVVKQETEKPVTLCNSESGANVQQGSTKEIISVADTAPVEKKERRALIKMEMSGRMLR